MYVIAALYYRDRHCLFEFARGRAHCLDPEHDPWHRCSYAPVVGAHGYFGWAIGRSWPDPAGHIKQRRFFWWFSSWVSTIKAWAESQIKIGRASCRERV